MKITSIKTVSFLALAAIALPALASNPELPPEQYEGSIGYITGGIGSTEAKAFESQLTKHRLAIEVLEHTGKRDAFTGDATVTIADKSGNPLLDVQTDGPFLLVDLPPGRYSVTASLNEKVLKKRTVYVANNQTARATFVFPASTD
jgi:hypothetical protein